MSAPMLTVFGILAGDRGNERNQQRAFHGELPNKSPTQPLHAH
jgi:hypothetical protein